MIMYLIMECSVATKQNTNFHGTVSISFHGKGGKVVAISHTLPYLTNALWLADILEYGYSRECDAKRCWKYKNPENSKNWKSTTTIVPFVVEK